MNPKFGRWLRRIVPVLYALSLAALPLAAVAGAAAAAPSSGSGGGPIPIYNPKLEHQWFYGQRLEGTGLTPAQAAQGYAQAVGQAQGMTRAALSPQGLAPAGIPAATDTWRNLGPAPVTGTQDWSGSQAASGRISSIALSGSTLYVGTAGGGVWSSANDGASWTPLTDGQPSLAMGAVAVDPNNPSVIYAGTGEAHESGDSFYGEGLLKSTDGGTSWSVYGATYFAGSYIAAVVVNPLNSSDVYVAGNMGLYESTDAGNTWAKVGPWGNYQVTALVINPKNGDLYAAVEGNGIEESTDGGGTWTLLSNGVFSGLNFGNTALSIDAANPQILVASVAGTTQGGAVYETTDGGVSWTNLNAPPYFTASYFYGSGSGDQSWYDNTVAVDPANPSIIFAGGIGVAMTTNDGGSWSCVNRPVTGNPMAFHPDQHAMLFDSTGGLYVGNDGGIWEITAAGTSSQALVDLNTNLSTLQFYPGLSQEGNGAVITGGSQDNGSEEYTGNAAWPELYWGDGSGTVVDPANPSDILVSSDQGIYYNFGTGSGPSAVWTNVTPNGGMSSNWVTPVVLDPNSSTGTVLTGGNNLWEATDVWSATGSSLTWANLTATTNVSTYGDVSAIAVAPGDSNAIYVGYSSGTVIMTTNGGASWSNITPTSIDRWVTSITVSPTNPYQVYLTLSGAGMPQSQPSLPHVLYTADANVSTPTWTDISGNLPDAPVNSLVLDGSSVIVASDVGVFVTTDNGGSWSALGSGLPNTQVVQLVLTSNGVLLAATHGRGVWMISVGAPPAAATTVTGLSPNYGPLAGGTSVTVTGTDFTDVTAVDFGGAPAASYTVVSSTQITAVSPPTSVAGSVYVTVTAAGGISPDSSDGSFQYVSTATGFSLWSMSPGAATAGSSLSLYGNDFGTVGGSVYFTQSSGNTVAASTYWSDTEVTTTVPPVSSSLSPGNVSAAVYSNADGLSNSLPFTLIGLPHSVSVKVSRNYVPADGTTSSQLTATVTDVNNNPVPSTPVDFSTTLGSLGASSAVTNASGVATDTITSTIAGTVTVTATAASSVSGTATITFTAGAPAKVAVSAAPSSVPADGT
ncbi:MAG: Ig-like domain-containing protein, partial [Peptococcaceae bacterium]|nr:Ig-like domain-containing protein [Peptococcaceae bacterium]